MEAWTLVDGDALRTIFNTKLDNSKLGIPNQPDQVERIEDPKRTLEQAYRTVVGERRSRKEQITHFLTAIGEQVRLDQLRRVSSYQKFEQDLQIILQELYHFR